MTRKEYNPRVNNYRPDASLSSAVSSAQIYSYDEKRPDYVAFQQDPGADYRQLARALSSFQPTLAQYAEDKQIEENRKIKATASELAIQQDALGANIRDFTQAWPEHLPKSPVAQRAVRATYLKGEAQRYNIALNERYREDGWTNLAPDEVEQRLAAFDLEQRQSLAQRGFSEEAVEEIASVYTPATQQSQNAILNRYATERNAVELNKMGQQFQESVYATVEARLADPEDDFFAQGSLAHNQQALAQEINLMVDVLVESGVPRYMAESWALKAVLKHAETLDVSEDDFRDSDLMDTLDYVHTDSGALGQTAEVMAERERISDSNRARRVARENRLKASKEKKNEEIAKAFGAAFLSGQPDFQTVCSENGFDPTDLDVVTNWNKAIGAQEKAADVAETPANRQFATEMELGIFSGKVSFQDILDAFTGRQLTVSQKDHLISRKASVEGKEPAVNRLATQAGFGDALKRVSDVFNRVGPGDETIDLSIDASQLPLVATRVQIAQELLTQRVLNQLYALNNEDLNDFTKEQKARQIVNDAAMYFLGEGRETVFQAADKALQENFLYRPAVTDAYATMGQHEANKTTAPVFRPAPDSVLAGLSETEVAWAEHFEKVHNLPETSLLTFVAANKANGLDIDTSTLEAMDYWARLIQNQADSLRRAGTEPSPEEIMELVMPGYGEKMGQVQREKYQQQLETITPVIGARLTSLESAANAVAAFQKGQRTQALVGLEEEFKRLGVVNPSKQLISQALYAVYAPLYESASDKQKKKARKITTN